MFILSKLLPDQWVSWGPYMTLLFLFHSSTSSCSFLHSFNECHPMLDKAEVCMINTTASGILGQNRPTRGDRAEP